MQGRLAPREPRDMDSDLCALIGENFRGDLRANEPLARHTSLKVGGAAECFAVPADLADLQGLLTVLAERNIPYLVIGGGFNLLVRDGGWRGVVVSLTKLNRLERRDGNQIYAEAGVANLALALFAEEEGFAGLEFLAWIPGSVGGAVAMNAGAHGGATLEMVETLVTLRDNELLELTQEELVFGYRYLRLDPGEIVVAATFRMMPGDAHAIAARMADYQARRGGQKVGFPNAGSFFKNPPGRQAWQLIDEAGLRGHRIGGAQVSAVHSNFLVNCGGAAARDFLELAELIRERVKEVCGIELEQEVRVVGEE